MIIFKHYNLHFDFGCVYIWDMVFKKDRPDLAQNCITAGWSPPSPNPKKDPASLENCPFIWRSANAGAWNIFAWANQSAEQRELAAEVANKKPEVWWACCTDRGLPSLERVHSSGLVDFSQEDSGGNTIVHEVMLGKGQSRIMIEWLAKKCPHLFTKLNHAGASPLTMTGDQRQDGYRAYASEVLMKTVVLKPQLKQVRQRL
jgi:hypothetical protein